MVLISQIAELRLGQNTPNFKRNPLPECEVGPVRMTSSLPYLVILSLKARSFSLLYSERSLDIVCKDKREFEVWTTGLQVSHCNHCARHCVVDPTLCS